MHDCKSVQTPCDVSISTVSTSEGDELHNKTEYQTAVGCLLYLSTRTRPDITYAVSKVARFSCYPSGIHWVAVKRIFRCLKGTISHGLLFNNEGELLYGYSDADWAVGRQS